LDQEVTGNHTHTACIKKAEAPPDFYPLMSSVTREAKHVCSQVASCQMIKRAFACLLATGLINLS